MYCPQCGYRPTTENARFCQTCGFPMDGVTSLLASGGAVVPVYQGPVVEAGKRPSSTRKRIRQGAKLMFLSAVLLPIFFGISIASDTPGPLVVPLTIFLAGLAWSLYNKIFGEDEPAPPTQIPAPSTPRAIGPRPYTTGGLVQPPSVTEHTTKLFEDAK